MSNLTLFPCLSHSLSSGFLRCFPLSLSFFGKDNVRDKGILNRLLKISFYHRENINMAKELMLHTSVVTINESQNI